MNSLELRHLESLCRRLGIDTHEIDQTLTYRENKHILLERFGIHDQKHKKHLTGYIERLQDLAENWRGYPKELLTEPLPMPESLDNFEAEIIETSQPIGPSQPSGQLVEWPTIFQQPATREPSGPYANWQDVFRTPKVIVPRVLHVERPETENESIGFGPFRIDITPSGEMKAKLDLLRPLRDRFAVREIRLWC